MLLSPAFIFNGAKRFETATFDPSTIIGESPPPKARNNWGNSPNPPAEDNTGKRIVSTPLES